MLITHLLLCRIPKHTRWLERHILAVQWLPSPLNLGTASLFTPVSLHEAGGHDNKLAIQSNRMPGIREACLQYYSSNRDGINCQQSRQSGCMCHSGLLMLTYWLSLLCCYQSPGKPAGFSAKLCRSFPSKCRFLSRFGCVGLLFSQEVSEGMRNVWDHFRDLGYI